MGTWRQPAQVVGIAGDQCDVGTHQTEECAEQCERTGRRRGEHAPRRAAGARRGQRLQIAARFAADQADGHGQDAQCEQHADGRGDQPGQEQVVMLVAGDQRHSRLCGEVMSGGTLLAREGVLGLDQPSGARRQPNRGCAWPSR